MMITNNQNLKSTPDLLNKYEIYREQGIELIKDVIRYVPKESFMSSAKQLGISKGKNIYLNNEDESAVLFDFVVHHYQYNGKTAIIRYVDNKLNIAGELQPLLQAKKNSYYAILKVESVSKYGGIVVLDMLRGNQQKLLIDKGLNLSITKPAIIASTIMEFPEFIMTSGASLPVTSMSSHVSYLLDNDFKEFTIKSKLEQSTLIATFLKYCLGMGISEHIRYI
ncbi:MAG: hypothetical protein ACK5Z5_07760 [Neisseriaceae bacterium]|jgi:hypothetical protein